VWIRIRFALERRKIMAWGDNMRRLFGVHDLTNADAADLLGFSQQAISEWVSKTRAEPRQPNLTTLLRCADFFHISGDRLARADFAELLEQELADADRFRQVEAEIRRRRSKLVPVRIGEPTELLKGTRVAKLRGKSTTARKATGRESGLG